MGAPPLTASSDRPVVDPLPPTTVPPVCAWMVDAASVGTPKIVVAQGLTTINYQGKRVVLRDQPEVARWYGLTVFLTSLVTLVALLIWLYFLYR
jgi:hypothetical protein